MIPRDKNHHVEMPDDSRPFGKFQEDLITVSPVVQCNFQLKELLSPLDIPQPTEKRERASLLLLFVLHGLESLQSL